eukprot:6589601-Alexandrium_andersonii.AAC.1
MELLRRLWSVQLAVLQATCEVVAQQSKDHPARAAGRLAARQRPILSLPPWSASGEVLGEPMVPGPVQTVNAEVRDFSQEVE